MGYTISEQRIKELKKYLEEHPIDRSLDELFEMVDVEVPREQAAARMAYSILKDIGEIKE